MNPSGGPEALDAVRLVHITTVPETLSFLTGQVGYMQSQGFEVFAISSPGPRLQAFAAQEHVSCRAVAMTRRISPLDDLRSLLKLWRELRRIRPAIVHGHTPKGGLLGMIAAWLAGVPVRIYHVHGLPLTTATGLKRKLLCWSERLACYFSHQVLCVSRSVREVAVQQRLCPAGKIKVLAQGTINGIDAQRRFNPQRLAAETAAQLRCRYGIPADARVLGFVGRIVRDKGLLELCAAWRELREQFADVHVLVAGPFESQDRVPPDVEHTLRSDARIHLAGEVADMPALYSAVDVILLPTYREGFPYVPLEAAAMGIPVVATRVPGCVEAIEDGVTGTLVAPRDAAALVEAARRYLADADLRRRHGTAGRQRMLRDFQPETVWIAILQEYQRWLGIRGLAGKIGHRATLLV